MVAYRNALFAPPSLGELSFPSIHGPTSDADAPVDFNAKDTLAFFGVLEGNTISNAAQSLLDSPATLTGKPFDPKTGIFTEHFTSSASQASITYDKDGYRTQSTLRLNEKAANAIIDQTVEAITKGQFHNLAEIEAIVKKGSITGPSQGLDYAKQVLGEIGDLKKEWKFGFDKDGNISQITVGGKPVDKNSGLWSVGQALQSNQNDRLAMDGYVNGYETYWGGQTFDGRPTVVGSASPATINQPAAHKPKPVAPV